MKLSAQTFAAVVFLCLCSCSKPTSVPSVLDSSEAKALQASFERLDHVLAVKGVAIQTNLAPPASPTEIAKLRAALGGNKIDALEAWFCWHNGTAGTRTDLLPLGYPLTIAESLDDRKLIQKIPFVDKLRKSAIKIMDDGAGDGFFLDVTSASPTVFYHMLEDPTPQYYGSLHEFVDYIAGAFENGALFVDAAGRLKHDETKYQAWEKEHFKKLIQ